MFLLRVALALLSMRIHFLHVAKHLFIIYVYKTYIGLKNTRTVGHNGLVRWLVQFTWKKLLIVYKG